MKYYTLELRRKEAPPQKSMWGFHTFSASSDEEAIQKAQDLIDQVVTCNLSRLEPIADEVRLRASKRITEV